MKKEEAEQVIKSLCGNWAKERGINPAPETEVSFSEFASWLNEKGYEHYLNFRSVMGSRHDAEQWFIDEMKQRWRY